MPTTNGRALPTGTVTFLFLDIERSTELLQQLGPEYPALLAAYRDLSGSLAAENQGAIFGSEGDGLFVAFPEAGGAVATAIGAQLAYAGHDWPAGAEVKVRMGLHTGTPTLIGDDYTGIDVHRAARIMSAGWGGQILMSEATETLLAGEGPGARELGWFSMKGLSRDECIFQVEAPGLAHRFPPLRARRREVQLPAALTPLIGRERDIEAVAALLDSGARLVTLSGPGGVGKSRLAMAVAERLGSVYSDGVVYADLSNETDPTRMSVVLAESVGATGGPNQAPFDSLVDHLAPLHLLLVVDGFERISAAAVDVSELLSRCPRLQLLVASRVVLRIGAEREHPVRPLPVPPPGSGFEVVRDAAAVQLFADRVKAVRPGFDLIPENASVVRDLVSALDGVPLSIELAAVRARVLSPEAIFGRLGSVLDLGGASPDLPARQQSLRATIEWSHGLLDPTEQRLVRRLGAFVDGWTIEAAETVAGDDVGDVFLGLENLVAQSLVHVSPDGRMSMSTAMREFAEEQMSVSGEDRETRHRHAKYFADLARESEPGLRGTAQHEMLGALGHDWRNFRAAADWAMRVEEWDLAGEIYANIWILSWMSDLWAESATFTKRLMPYFDRLDEPLRARSLFIAAGVHMEMGDGETALTLVRPAIEMSQRLGDRANEAWCRLIVSGSVVYADPFDPEARAQIDRAVELARSLDDPFLLAYGLSFHGTRSTLDGDIAQGVARHQECLGLARQLDNSILMTQAHGQLAMSHLAGGDVGSARLSLEQGLEHVEAMRSIEALTVYLDAAAWLAFAENDPVRAMTALGSADEARMRVGAARWGILDGLFEAAGIAAESDVPTLARARDAGRVMTPHEAIVFALAPHHDLAVVA